MYRTGKLLMSAREIDALLNSMSHREREAFARQYSFRMTTLEDLAADGLRSNNRRLLRALDRRGKGDAA